MNTMLVGLLYFTIFSLTARRNKLKLSQVGCLSYSPKEISCGEEVVMIAQALGPICLWVTHDEWPQKQKILLL